MKTDDLLSSYSEYVVAVNAGTLLRLDQFYDAFFQDPLPVDDFDEEPDEEFDLLGPEVHDGPAIRNDAEDQSDEDQIEGCEGDGF